MDDITIRVAAITGHRPNSLFGYDIMSPQYNQIRADLRKAFIDLKIEAIISGMALGIDQIAVEEALKLDLFVCAAVPFKGQESKWPLSAQTKYHELLNQCHIIATVSDGGYSVDKLTKRNHWMVDKADVVIGVWNGPSSSGGTTECVTYTRKKGKPFYWIEPKKQVRGYRWNDDVPEEDRKNFALNNLIDHRIERKYEAGVKIERWEIDAYSPERTELLCAKYPRLFKDTGKTRMVGFPFQYETKVYEFIEDNGL